MNQQPNTLPKPEQNPSIMVASVLENMAKDIAFGQCFLCHRLETYECCPKLAENELVSDVLGDMASLNSIIAESDKTLKIIAEAWGETLNYFNESLEDYHVKDKSYVDLNHSSPLVTKDKLIEIIHTFLEFCEKAEQSTKMEQSLHREMQQYIDDMKEAVCNISKDMKIINSLKLEIYCGAEDILNEVYKHEETLNVFHGNWKACDTTQLTTSSLPSEHPSSQEKKKEVGLKRPVTVPTSTNKPLHDNTGVDHQPQREAPVDKKGQGLPIEDPQRKQVGLKRPVTVPTSTNKPLHDNSGVDHQLQREAPVDKKAQGLHIEKTPKRIEDIVNRFDQMSTKARQELQKRKAQDEVLQQTADAIKKSQEARGSSS